MKPQLQTPTAEAPRQRWFLMAALASIAASGLMFLPALDPRHLNDAAFRYLWPVLICFGVFQWVLRHFPAQFSIRTLLLITGYVAVAFALGRSINPAVGVAWIGCPVALVMLADVWRQRNMSLKRHEQFDIGIICITGCVLLVHCARMVFDLALPES